MGQALEQHQLSVCTRGRDNVQQAQVAAEPLDQFAKRAFSGALTLERIRRRGVLDHCDAAYDGEKRSDLSDIRASKVIQNVDCNNEVGFSTGCEIARRIGVVERIDCQR
jgi:hypothetical protein